MNFTIYQKFKALKGDHKFINWGKFTGFITGLGGLIIVFHNLITAPAGQYLWAENFDSKLIYWIVNWGHHILVEMRDPINFWNANSFYPGSQTLAYSDSLLSIQFLFSPLRAFGISPLSSLYLSLAGFTLFGCILTEKALRRLGIFSYLEIAFICFATHFSLSFIAYLNHYQLFGFHLAPAFFLYLFLYLKEFRRKDFIITCGLFCLGTAFATYLAPMEISLSIAFVIPSIAIGWRKQGFANWLKKIGWVNVLIGLSFALILYIIQLKPYISTFDHTSSPNLKDYVIYSASPISLLKHASIFSFWYGKVNYSAYGQWEYSYFPGFILLVLGFTYITLTVGAISLQSFRMIQKTKKIYFGSLSTEAILILCIFIFFFLSWDLSLGPYIKKINIPNPIYWLFVKVIPGMDNIRAPGRFGIWMGLPLSIFSIFLVRKIKIKKIFSVVIILGLFFSVVLESLPNFPIFPFAIDPQGIYKEVSLHISPNTPLIELPIFKKDQLNTLRNVQRQLDGSTIHWARLVIGYGARTSPDYDEIVSIDSATRQVGNIQPMLDFAQKLDISHFLIYLPDYPVKLQKQWNDLGSASTSCKLLEENGYILFKMNAKSCP